MDQSLQDKILLETFYNFPVCGKPFERLSEKLGIEEKELMDKVVRFKSSGHIRQIGPVFDYSSLGYEGTLLAAKVAPGKVEAFNKLLFSYSGVTHCYVRDAEFNIWFTYVYRDEHEFADFFDTLLMHPACDWLINLPKKKNYKTAINFIEEAPAVKEPGEAVPELSDKYARLVSKLQTDLPVSSRPFKALADEINVHEDELITSINYLLDNGFIKRFGSRLNHVKAGLSHNALYAAQVDEKAFEKVSSDITGLWNVSHCYIRYTSVDWPYNLYVMVHGRSEEELGQAVQNIKRLAGVQNDAILYTIEELIKRRPVFLREADCRLAA